MPYRDDEVYLDIAVEMLKDRLRPKEPWAAEMSDLDPRLRGMLDRCAELVRNDRGGTLQSRQSIAAVIVAWEATQPEAVNKALIYLANNGTGAISPARQLGTLDGRSVHEDKGTRP